MKWREKSTRLLTVIDLVVKTRPSKAVRVKVIVGLFARRILTKRLNRDLRNRFGTQAYAAEELIAELTSAFLCAHLGVNGELRHASYIDHWIALLKEDNRAIFTAASKASQAADCLRSFSEHTQ